MRQRLTFCNRANAVVMVGSERQQTCYADCNIVQVRLVEQCSRLCLRAFESQLRFDARKDEAVRKRYAIRGWCMLFIAHVYSRNNFSRVSIIEEETYRSREGVLTFGES